MPMRRKLQTLEEALLDGSTGFINIALRDVLLASYGNYDEGLEVEMYREAELLFHELATFYDKPLTRDKTLLALEIVNKLRAIVPR